MIVQSLDGAWELRQVGSEEAIKARVPGCVHLDLARAGKISDPFHGDNEYRVAWVHEADWVYSRRFKLDPGLAEADRVYLECDGLDTIADLALNGSALGRAENMYLQHRFDVTKRLARGENEIEIEFASPVNFVKPLVAKDPFISPGDSIPGSMYLRKCPSQWGWDWGPKLPTSGIWRPIRLAGYRVARIEDVRIRQNHHRKSVTVDVEVAVERFKRAPCRVLVALTHPDGSTEQHDMRLTGSRTKCSFAVKSPTLWWPNGYGDQPLYTVEAVLTGDGGELHRLTRGIGLRTIKLEQKKDRHGRGFTFVVNGVPIFAKGADWIPADQFPARLTPEHYRHLISSAARANMNMLRVWGGGHYEDESFYDACDEHGILVWQDFMFACALYPVDKPYLDNVASEVEHNIKRLRNRACLALWCGNNEMEWFLAGDFGGDKNPLRRKQYLRIFHDLIPSLAARLDPVTPYWPSSPSSGGKPFEEPNSESVGDGHYWDVWHGRQPFAAYRSHFFRFASEFGFESFPAIETCKSFAKNDDLNTTSYIMECHQKNSAGNGLILYYLAQTFRFPANFEMMCYVSQLLQAEAMRCGIEHWRRNRGRCMGALYWQYNDCWPVASWSGIDYFGRWKALQYAARRFFAPVLLSVEEEGTRAKLHVTNDTTRPVSIELRWSLERLDGTVIRRSKVKTRVDGETSRMLADLDFAEELEGDAIRQAVLVSELLVGGARAALVVTPFVPSKHLELPPARIEVAAKRDGEGPYLEVSAPVTARFVCLAVPGRDVIFSDNCFDLPAGRSVAVRVESETDDAALAKARAYSLVDSY